MIALRTPAERIDMILDEACRRWSVDRAELLGEAHLPNLITARRAVILALREFAPKRLSYDHIAILLCRAGHGSLVRHAKSARELRKASPGFDRGVAALVAIAQGRTPATPDRRPLIDLPGVGLVPEMNAPALARVSQ